jgi:hypothetical protein
MHIFQNIKALSVLVSYCFCGYAALAQVPTSLKLYPLHSDFDSCALQQIAQVWPSKADSDFKAAYKKMHTQAGLALSGPQRYRPKGRFQRGLYTYWLCFRVENRSEATLDLGVEQHFLRQVWVETTGAPQALQASPAATAPSIGFHLAPHPIYHYPLPQGKTAIFYLQLQDDRIAANLVPRLWTREVFDLAQAARLQNVALGQTIFLSLFFTLAIIGSIFYLSRRRAVFGWYMAFKWSLALYFLQEIVDYNALHSGQTPWVDWKETKAGLVVAVFFTYLKFILAFVKDRIGSEWMVSLQKPASVFLLGYFGLDLLLLNLGYWFWSWVLFYLFLWSVVLYSIRALWFLHRIQYSPTRYIFRGAFALIAGFFLSLLAFTFFEAQLSSIKGIELGFLPIGIGGILESVFFLVSLGEQEKHWLQERLAFRERETRALERRQVYEHRLQSELEQELNKVKAQLSAQEQEILSNRELDLKNQRELAFKRLQLRTLRYGFLAKTSEDILQQLNQHLANDQPHAADEQLTRFGGFVRDLLFYAAEPNMALQTELQLCRRLIQLNGFGMGIPDLGVQLHWRCPSLFFLSLIYHSAKSAPKNALSYPLQVLEKESAVEISLVCPQVYRPLAQEQAEIWQDAQEQLQNFNESSDFVGGLSENEQGWKVVIEKKIFVP